MGFGTHSILASTTDLMPEPPVLTVEGLKTWFHTRDGVAKSVDGVDLKIYPGEVLGIVGESGCGKSVSALSIMRLIPPPGKIEAGEIRFNGEDLLSFSADDMARLRGDQISMIFQDPSSSLNPVVHAGKQIAEVYEIHRKSAAQANQDKAIEMLTKVGIPDPGKRALAYPHELSGGMAQRVMIAMALACEPQLLIADEPTTALDVTIQSQILQLIGELQEQTHAAVILITHDLGVVAQTADRVAVMYAGEIVEEGAVQTLFDSPQHPYTQQLLRSIPMLGANQEELAVIPGRVPSLVDLPKGCRFAARCEARSKADLPACTAQRPTLAPISTEHKVRCWLHRDQP
jgi:oligopeptide/dipeptide ABC transporter ATP-binding protein|tara:strand:- start:7390 stop:8424 length:1035 start_codon:yes stop_codon:yes gene_type:complete